MDTSWSTAKEPWQRLRWARMAWQNQTGQAISGRGAARALGMQENTYTAYERPPGGSKHTDLDFQRARQFANKFKVSWLWLLTGDGSPFDAERKFSPEAASVAERLDSLPEGERKAKADAIRALLTGT